MTKVQSVACCPALVICMPDAFQDPAFQAWLNDVRRTKCALHVPGQELDEQTEVIVFVDSSLCGEGRDDDMPQPIWEEILQVCREQYIPSQGPSIMVRLTNLEE